MRDALRVELEAVLSCDIVGMGTTSFFQTDRIRPRRGCSGLRLPSFTYDPKLE